MPIKMTKELPTKSGWYYWKSCDYDDLVFVLYFDGNNSVFRSEMCRSDLVMIAANPEDMGGYWAKVDKDQFEFE